MSYDDEPHYQPYNDWAEAQLIRYLRAFWQRCIQGTRKPTGWQRHEYEIVDYPRVEPPRSET